MSEEEIELRIEGDDSLPNLIYLPGVHGDWTMIGNLSHYLRGKVRLVVVTYPRTLSWTLDDYAAAVEASLNARNIRQGWLLAESFSSQVTWAIIGRAKFAVQGIILAGGFVKHPMRWVVRPVGVLCRRSFLRLFLPIYRFYMETFRLKDRDHRQKSESLDAFITRRTELDLQAMRHRLRLIADNDPRKIACQTTVPVFGLTGLVDPIVPWPLVRRWLRKHCPALRDYCIIAGSDHTVLNMAAEASAQKILEWIKV
jgi:pimeloyl-ACP methyl ester carboxylesterase